MSWAPDSRFRNGLLGVTGARRTPKKRSSRNGADAAEPNDQTRDRVLGPRGVIRKSLGFCKTDYDSTKLFDRAETVGLSRHPALRPPSADLLVAICQEAEICIVPATETA
jgi:hypothetical protein